MNKRDWFYKETVTQGAMDEAFDWVESADHALVEDMAFTGIVTGLGVTPSAPADMQVTAASGTAYGKDGERILLAESTAVDCTVDEYGVPTTVVTAGNKKWLSLFVRFVRRPEVPQQDGNGLTVYTKQYEDAEVILRQGTEAVSPTKPALLSDGILLADIRIAYGQTAITAADIEPTGTTPRREDWVRVVTTNLGTLVHGTAHDAIVALIEKVDDLSGAGGVAFSFAQSWYGSVNVGVPSSITIADVGDALNAIVADLKNTSATSGAQLVGSKAYTSTNGYCNFSISSVYGVLTTIAAAVDGHIAGGAPSHPASGVTFSDTNLFAHWGVHADDVQEAIDDIIDLLVSEAADSAGAYRIGFDDGYVQILNKWTDFTAATVEAAITMMAAALNEQGTTAGTERIGIKAISGSPTSLSAGSLHSAISALLTAVNARARIASNEAISGDWTFSGKTKVTGRLVATNANRNVRGTMAAEADATLHNDGSYFHSLRGGSFHPRARFDALCTQLHETHVDYRNDWAHVGYDKNTITIAGVDASNVALVDVFPVLNTDADGDLDGKYRYIFVVGNFYATDHLEARCWLIDPLTMTTVATYTHADFAANLPTAGSPSWIITAGCSAGKFVVLQFRDQPGTPGDAEHYLQAWRPNTDGSLTLTWTGHTTGIHLPGQGVYTGSYSATSDLCVARNRSSGTNYVASLNPWNDRALGGIGTELVSIVELDSGDNLQSGYGDIDGCGAGSDLVTVLGGLCSDGSYIYYTWENTTSDPDTYGVATIDIASLAAGTPNVGRWNGAAPWPIRINDGIFQSLVFDGSWLWAPPSNGEIRVFDPLASGATPDLKVKQIEDSTNIDGFVRYCAFDGINVWLQVYESATNKLLEAHQVDVAAQPFVTDIGITRGRKKIYQMLKPSEQGASPAIIAAGSMGRMCFDGDAIWMIMDDRRSETMSGILRKIPRAAYR